MKLERLRTRLLLLSSVSILPIFLYNQSAEAACILAPTAGNDNFVCDSGTGGPLNDTSGNDMLTLPTGGTGTITGPVNLGSGADTVIISSGTINGNLNTGAGNDRVELNDGIVNGTILQNSRADTFTMTGGQIGEVNLEHADSEMRMSGGTIDRFVIAAQGRDLLVLSGGSIGTFVDLGIGDNRIFVSAVRLGARHHGHGKRPVYLEHGGDHRRRPQSRWRYRHGNAGESHRCCSRIHTIAGRRGGYGYDDIRQHDRHDGRPLRELGKCRTDEQFGVHTRAISSWGTAAPARAVSPSTAPVRSMPETA